MIEITVEKHCTTCAGAAAISLSDRREVEIPIDELSYFWQDCETWLDDLFEDGFSFETQIKADRWDSWLEMFEVL